MATTILNNLINPQVVADMIDKKLVDLMKFAPLATIDNTLVGVPGNTIYLPSYSYIGDASTVSEASEVSLVSLVATSVTATVHKIAKGTEITDEAVLSGFGDPVQESVDQLTLAIASCLDNEMLAILHAITGTMLYETSDSSTLPTDTHISPALEKFGEDIDGVKVALVSPAVYTNLRSNTNSWVPASEIAAGIAVKGVVGEYQGCQIMVSNKLASGASGAGDIYIVKPGALRIYMKRDTLVEVDRDIVAFKTVMTASKHEVCYLYDSSKAIRIAKKA